MKNKILAQIGALAIVFFFIGINLVPIRGGAQSEKIGAMQPKLLGGRGQFYAYDLYTYYTVTFDQDAVLNNIAYAGIFFLSGADCDVNGNWYAVGITGGLYLIDKETGVCTYIALTIPLVGFTYDVTTDTWFANDPDNLYTIDIFNGASTFIGDFGINDTMTGLMCDIGGNLYGRGVSTELDSCLYSIDKITGQATFIGGMGPDYVTGGNFDRNDNTLYLTALDMGQYENYLAICDPDTGEVVILNYFSPNDEIVALAIPYTLPDHYLIAEFTWTPHDPFTEETILFNASESYDSDGNITLYEWDWDNDGVYEEAHATPTTTYAWDTPGSYPVRLRVTDTLNFTAEKTHVIHVISPPPSPPVIHGPDDGIVNVSYTFTTDPVADPNGDSFYGLWDWGDGNFTEWLGPYPPGSIMSASHAWTHAGVYEIRAKLKGIGGESNWSEPHVITIKNVSGPTTPIIDGPTQGKVNVKYDFTFNSTDENYDVISYVIMWGDGTSDNVSGPSGTETVVSHTWSKKGAFTVTARARNIWGAWSDWGSFPVTIPCSFIVPMLPFFEWLFERFPHAFPLLRGFLSWYNNIN